MEDTCNIAGFTPVMLQQIIHGKPQEAFAFYSIAYDGRRMTRVFEKFYVRLFGRFILELNWRFGKIVVIFNRAL